MRLSWQLWTPQTSWIVKATTTTTGLFQGLLTKQILIHPRAESSTKSWWIRNSSDRKYPIHAKFTLRRTPWLGVVWHQLMFSRYLTILNLTMILPMTCPLVGPRLQLRQDHPSRAPLSDQTTLSCSNQHLVPVAYNCQLLSNLPASTPLSEVKHPQLQLSSRQKRTRPKCRIQQSLLATSMQ